MPSGTVAQARIPFQGTISRIDSAQARRMTGVSWRPGCPVPLRDLRLLRLSRWGFDGRAGFGRLIVHRDVARDVVGIFRRLFARTPVHRGLMHPNPGTQPVITR